MDECLAARNEGPAHHDEWDPDVGTDSLAYQTAGQLGCEKSNEEDLDGAQVSMADYSFVE